MWRMSKFLVPAVLCLGGILLASCAQRPGKAPVAMPAEALPRGTVVSVRAVAASPRPRDAVLRALGAAVPSGSAARMDELVILSAEGRTICLVQPHDPKLRQGLSVVLDSGRARLA